MTEKKDYALSRWRLVLGKYAGPKMLDCLSPDQERMDQALEILYSREYRKGRGVRQDNKIGPGSLDPSQLNVPLWLAQIRELFPKSTCERITKHALERYNMVEIVQDEETLKQLEPSSELLGALLSLKGQMNGTVLAEARRLIARIVEDLKRKLKAEIINAMAGQRNRFQNSPYKVSTNFDAIKTIKRNLKHWDPERKKLIVESPRFFQRVKRKMPWDIILCIDQSASMVNSVIHSAVMAGILAELSSVRVRLVVFDTAVVDLSEHVSDPVEVLMSVQLGGGTNIGKAVRYCAQLVSIPRRTIFVLVSDFGEGADPRILIAACKSLAESGVKLIGLASLEKNAAPWYDKRMAQELAQTGMQIAALTPCQLANWLAEVMQRGAP